MATLDIDFTTWVNHFAKQVIRSVLTPDQPSHT